MYVVTLSLSFSFAAFGTVALNVDKSRNYDIRIII